MTMQGKIVWRYAVPITVIHVLALLVFVPWLFSWTGIILVIIGLYFYGSFGVNMGYHRLLAHRAFKCPTWVERSLVFIALCCMEDTPGRWVATHRMHHKLSDEVEDPHSPLVNFFWSHMGWLFVENRGLHNISTYERYARDILRQPFYLALERRLLPIWIYAAHAAIYFLAGYAVGAWLWGAAAGLQFGLSLFVWGVLLRTVLVWHITWSVNSLSHLFGYRSYATREQSRNNWLVAMIAAGEGWHNNHHDEPTAASNWHRWWEIDLSYATIKTLEKLGLAHDVIPPRRVRREK